MKPDAPLHILVYRLSALGDVAMTLPVVYSVARRYPQHTLHIVTTTFCAQLYVNAPSNIVLHPVEPHSGTFHLLKHLSGLHVDAVADLHNVLRSWVVDVFFLIRGKRVKMLQKQRGERRRILSQRIAQAEPFTQRYFDVFARLGLPAEPQFTSLFASPPAMPAEWPKGSERWIGVAPFARYASKTYPLEQMQQVVGLLAKRPHTRIFLFGSRGAEARLLESWQQAGGAVCSVAGRFTLAQELALMAHLDVMLTMDSANMHLASLAGTRVVSFWGSTTPACGFMGYGQQPSDAVCAHVACQPCTIAGSDQCPKGDWKCMHAVKPEQIVRAVTKDS